MEEGISRHGGWHKAVAADLISGLTTSAVVVPKALAYATIGNQGIKGARNQSRNQRGQARIKVAMMRHAPPPPYSP
jgi:hypothetical protein